MECFMERKIKYYQSSKGVTAFYCTCGVHENIITPKEPLNMEFQCKNCNKKYWLKFEKVIMLKDVVEQ